MKGIIFNLFEDFICETHGEELFDKIIDAGSLTTPEPELIVAPGTYPDDDFFTIVSLAADSCGQPESELLREFGRFALPRLAERYPVFFAPFNHPRDFLKHTGMVHHVEVKKLYHDADTPFFSCREGVDGVLVLRYSSKRNLCSMVEGLIDGLAAHFGVAISHKQIQCAITGAECCEFHLTFA